MGELESSNSSPLLIKISDPDEGGLRQRALTESKLLWRIIGPAIISRLSSYSWNCITQAFTGHIGEIELAAFSILSSVVCGFDLGFLIGMSSAMDTLCGQAYGGKQYEMLGVYLQRSCLVLLATALLLLPLYLFTAPLLKLLGQPPEVADLAGQMALCTIPMHFSFAFIFPLHKFLQCQYKNSVYAWAGAAGLFVHLAVTWLVVSVMGLGAVAASAVQSVTWWFWAAVMAVYILAGGCPLTWQGFSVHAFSGLWEFVKLSAASGVMICLENWYYRILVLMIGNMDNAAIAIGALSVCMSINGWENSIPLSFCGGTSVRVANELGAGKGKKARFATIVSVVTSTGIGVLIMTIILVFHKPIALLFTSSKLVLDEVNSMSLLLALTILFNSVQPVLSGVAVGSGWQGRVAYINIACYYIVGLPLGILMQWVFHMGIMGVWGGMIFGGTALQTVILCILTIRCDWDKEAEKATKYVKKWSEV
ncbi:protein DETOXIFICATION 27-like [Andrographis paniculata]|uniref:protein DETOXIFICATION 27-like n=1 Tax=Andrographis paniculata TaxID=175694 RepID=UPI0021E7DDF1|nr:protein DETOXIFICATION 27-like [Andrographis paniculata]